ncbi:MAG TPA: hypothetical protein VFC93_13060 [Chloroflexota bacterium]|jgi:hypothetical protein|nr:hypothetical protein [Chloroflexota bacterium]
MALDEPLVAREDGWYAAQRRAIGTPEPAGLEAAVRALPDGGWEVTLPVRRDRVGAVVRRVPYGGIKIQRELWRPPLAPEESPPSAAA